MKKLQNTVVKDFAKSLAISQKEAKQLILDLKDCFEAEVGLWGDVNLSWLITVISVLNCVRKVSPPIVPGITFNALLKQGVIQVSPDDEGYYRLTGKALMVK